MLRIQDNLVRNPDPDPRIYASNQNPDSAIPIIVVQEGKQLSTFFKKIKHGFLLLCSLFFKLF